MFNESGELVAVVQATGVQETGARVTNGACCRPIRRLLARFSQRFKSGRGSSPAAVPPQLAAPPSFEPPREDPERARLAARAAELEKHLAELKPFREKAGELEQQLADAKALVDHRQKRVEELNESEKYQIGRASKLSTDLDAARAENQTLAERMRELAGKAVDTAGPSVAKLVLVSAGVSAPMATLVGGLAWRLGRRGLHKAIEKHKADNGNLRRYARRLEGMRKKKRPPAAAEPAGAVAASAAGVIGADEFYRELAKETGIADRFGHSANSAAGIADGSSPYGSHHGKRICVLPTNRRRGRRTAAGHSGGGPRSAGRQNARGPRTALRASRGPCKAHPTRRLGRREDRDAIDSTRPATGLEKQLKLTLFLIPARSLAMGIFGSDRVLLYNVNPWNTLGFGAPNFGENVGTKNTPIAGLVDEIGQIQLFTATHEDAMRKQPPSRNTVERIGKMINRVQTVLVNRMKIDNELRLEGVHATATPVNFNIHPVPFFASPIMRNHWLREYNELCMYALTNMMQHSDNNVPLTITEAFAKTVWAYFKEIKMLMGAELLLLDKTTLADDKFLFKDEHYAAYKPSSVTVNIEALDSPGPLFNLPTEDDLRPLLDGIPANLIASSLKQYVVTGPGDLSGTMPAPGSGAVGASGEGKAIGNAVIGTPSI